MQAIWQIWRRVLHMVARGRITVVDDSGAAQIAQAQMSGAEVQDELVGVGLYGYACNPPQGTDCVALYLGGDRSSGVIIATNNQTYRMRGLATGEVAISDDKGQSVYLSASGIRINGGGNPISIENTPSVNIAAETSIALTAPAIALNGTTVFNGPIASGTAAGAGSGHMAGPITVDTDVIVAGTSVHGHRHNQAGGGTTGTPI